jgi:hypothetical protein
VRWTRDVLFICGAIGPRMEAAADLACAEAVATASPTSSEPPPAACMLTQYLPCGGWLLLSARSTRRPEGAAILVIQKEPSPFALQNVLTTVSQAHEGGMPSLASTKPPLLHLSCT